MQIFGDKKFDNPIEIVKAFDNESFKDAFKEIEDLRNRPETYILGYIRYNAKEIFLGNKIKSSTPILYFEVFNKYEKFLPEKSENSTSKILANPIINYIDYSKAINKIKDEISNGNTYEVNYTYDWEIKTDLDSFTLYKMLLKNQKTPYNAYIKNEWDEILSFSPELFFELKGNFIKTKPMKGTVKRGKNELEDRENIEFLKNDEKNRAENVMIVDLLRNDLGKIAKTGTVKVDKLFDIETHPTVHQMTSEISAELDKKVTLFDIFNAIFPCGSITGAPKINTMNIIDEVETGKREVYCGAIGLIGPEGALFSVPIRLLERRTNENNFTCRVGGAIVWDSDAKDEWQETFTKTKFISNINDFKIIETIKVENGKMFFAKEHFDRMKKAAMDLGFEFNQEIFNIKPQKDGMLRILLSKNGNFETQYKPLNESKTNVIKISPVTVNSAEPLLKYKTTYKPWYEKSYEKIRNGEIYDEIFFNEKGELTEGARTNIVIEKDRKFFTPPIECGLLNGVLRESLINPSPQPSHSQATPTVSLASAELQRFPLSPARGEGKVFIIKKLANLVVKKLYLEDLNSADKIYCINSVRGIVEVNLIQ